MGRHAPRRAGRATLLSALAVAVAAGSITLFSSTEDTGAQAATTAAAGTTEIVLDDPRSDTPRTDRLLAAGTTGFLHRRSGVAGLLWTGYEDGLTVPVEGATGTYQPTTTSCYDINVRCASGVFGQAADTVALPHRTYGDPVSLWSPGGGALKTLDLSHSATRVGTYGETTVTVERNGIVDGQQLDGYVLHLVDLVDGKQRDRVVSGLPADGTWEINTGRTGDAKGALVTYPARDANGEFTSYTVGYLDFATAELTPAFTGLSRETVPEVVLTEDRVGWYTEASGLHLKPRTDLTAAETTPVAGEDLPGTPVPVLTGDWLVLATDGGSVRAVSLTDGTTKTLLPRSYGTPLAAPDGTALVTGGSGAADWWVQRVVTGADGTPQLKKIVKVPPLENPKRGVALSRGSLRVAEDSPTSYRDTTSVRTLTTNGSTELTASAATDGDSISAKCPYPDTTCSTLWGNNVTGPDDVYLSTYADLDEGGSGLENADQVVSLHDGWSDYTQRYGTQGGSIVDVSDDYAVYNSGGTTPTQYIGEFGYGDPLKRSVRAAALNGSVLWSATTTPGRLTSYSLTAKKTLSTVDVPDLGCVPSELQAAGRWVYWSCAGASAGVYDSKAARSVTVTPGDVLLGDGFTVRHDHEADQLVLTDTTTDTTRVVASGLPDSGLPVDRRFRWTVDEYTGLVAWFDTFEQTHVATTGVTPSAVTAFRTEAESYVEPGSTPAWTGRWVLSRPVTSWSLTFTSVQSGATGRATRTLTGGAASAEVTANWNGKTSSGIPFPNGDFTWTLKATGLGTTAPVTVTSGEGFALRGSAVRHDFVSPDGPDGRGDLLTLSTSGGLTFHGGTATGRFGEKVGAGGWPATIRAIPFGDLSGDRCNDVLVRLSSGALRLYKPGCGAAPKPSTSYTSLGTGGWNQYDVLTSPGDLSGDGRPDLIARAASTGTVYLYKGTSTGKLSARVKLYDNWKGYKKIIGAGDLNGDGIGDLLAQDTSHTLYRYDGTGAGTFKARVKLFTNWGGSYNVVVGVGDITDDGKADLISRDTGGTLWRNSGDGKGSFGARVKIATGFGSYKFLS
ncbi:FG-GAP-like repeat-containing protein [Streptomyces griseorubiginosus]|uniref:FG-GAP-like repeat-containing protein n=1 Tax=Streptomyces griseorubiginosus TaxID=67304 RepID=UPI0036381775